MLELSFTVFMERLITVAAPKPQSIPRPVAPKSKAPLKPFQRIHSAPASLRKVTPVKPQRVTNCIHVLKGAVWCNDCAHTFRVQARETYARALRESKNGEVIRAAKDQLAKAVKEYALTPAGINELEREYARLISVGRPQEAAKIFTQIEGLKKEVSERNISSRKAEEQRKARMTTARSHAVRHENKYIPALRNSKQEWTTNGAVSKLTHHTRERMELRNISEAEIDSAFASYLHVKPRGAGTWEVAGNNGVTLYGFFTKTSGKIEFVITTVFRPGSDEEFDE